MTALGRIRATVLMMAFAAMAALAVAPAAAQSPSYMRLSETGLDNQPVYLGVNKSMVIELPRPAGDVLVSNPAIADAVLRTSHRLYLIGVKLGQANIFLFDTAGTQIASFDVYVEADLGALNQLLAEAIPEGFVRADAMNGNIVLRGQVPSASASSRAQEITVGMLDGSSAGTTETGGTIEKHVVNLLTITGEEQVSLKVTIAEVQREVVKQLGINVKGTLSNNGVFGVGTNLEGSLGDIASGAGASPITFPFNTGTSPGEFGIGWTNGEDSLQATLKALEETRMLRTLAEPTLTAVSGETAEFLAGGEFPVPVGADEGEITIQFKPFGVNLAFTPVVLSAGRISLKVRTEVSELSPAGSVSLPISATSAIVIPGISVRRAETSVELPSGGSFVIAGLVQESTRRAASGLPLLSKLPVLGALFSSKDFLNNQTELVMIVTPYLVKPTSPQALARPDQNLMMADDAEAYFMHRLTKVYGSTAQVPAQPAGQVGFTFD